MLVETCFYGPEYLFNHTSITSKQMVIFNKLCQTDMYWFVCAKSALINLWYEGLIFFCSIIKAMLDEDKWHMLLITVYYYNIQHSVLLAFLPLINLII